MSGANHVKKFQEVDRENYVHELHYFGTLFHMRENIPAVNLANLTGDQLLQELLLTSLTPNALNGPTTAQLFSAFEHDVHGGFLAPGSQWSIVIQNTDAVAKVITMPAGWTPATITIPANSYGVYTFQIDSLSPQAISLVLVSGSTPPGVAGVSSFQGVNSGGPRTGAVVAVAGDYNTDMVLSAPGVPMSDVVVAGTTVSQVFKNFEMGSPNATTSATHPVGTPQVIPVGAWTTVLMNDPFPTFVHNSTFSTASVGYPFFTQPVPNSIAEVLPVPSNHKVNVGGAVGFDALLVLTTENIGVRIVVAGTQVVSKTVSAGTGVLENPADYTTSSPFIYAPGQDITLEVINNTAAPINLVNAQLHLEFVSSS